MSHPDPLYDDYDSFYEDDMELNDHEDDFDEFEDYYDDSMDGDHDSAMDSIGWGDDNSLAYGGGADDYGDW